MTSLYLKHLCISPFVPVTSENKLYYTMIYWLLKTVKYAHFWYSYFHLSVYIAYTYECVYVWMDG